MQKINFNQIVRSPYSNNAYIRDDFPGFKKDYLVLHSLIRKYNPKYFMEIGTSSGKGTKVICKAMGIKRLWLNLGKKVYSLDVPHGTDPKILYPKGEDGHPQKAGCFCNYPYKQIFGNSYGFDFSSYYPIDGWFVDGKHNYKYVKNDTKSALNSNPILIVWHDMQISGVSRAVKEIIKKNKKYNLFLVSGTRIAFAIKLRLKTICHQK